MSPFLRGMVTGLALLGLLLSGAAVAAFIALRSGGQLDPAKLRNLVLSEEERTWLAHRQERPQESPERSAPETVNEEELLQRIAELANADRAAGLVAQLRRQRSTLDERAATIDQREAELHLAQADLARLRRDLEGRERGLDDERKHMADEQSRWAAARVDEAQRVQVMDEVEKARIKDQAKLFEAMKDAAWQSLRRFEPKEIARYLSLMDIKKAARLMTLAQQDQDNPSLAPAVHREMLRIDLDGKTGSQVERLAALYAFMPASQVMPYLRDAKPQEIADVLQAMARSGNVKKRAELLEALRADDSRRELQVRQILDAGTAGDGKGEAQ